MSQSKVPGLPPPSCRERRSSSSLGLLGAIQRGGGTTTKTRATARRRRSAPHIIPLGAVLKHLERFIFQGVKGSDAQMLRFSCLWKFLLSFLQQERPVDFTHYFARKVSRARYPNRASLKICRKPHVKSVTAVWLSSIHFWFV